MKNKRIKLLMPVVIILLTIALLTGCITLGTPVAPTRAPAPSTRIPSPPALSTGTTMSVTPLTVDTQVMDIVDDYVTIHLQYPSISGMRDAAFQSSLNDTVIGKMKDHAAQVRDDAQSAFGTAGFMKYTMDSQVEVQRNDGLLLSMSIRFQSFEGGAHGSTDVIPINVINTDPGRQLRLFDIFTSSTEGRTRINNAIAAAIAADPGAYFPDTFTSVTGEEWFNITGTDLIIIFPSYSIAPGATGEPQFRIPLSSLSDILIPEIPH
jgi:hypothetical protein